MYMFGDTGQIWVNVRFHAAPSRPGCSTRAGGRVAASDEAHRTGPGTDKLKREGKMKFSFHNKLAFIYKTFK